MNAEEDYVFYLESNPELYPITKDSLYMNILESLSKEAKTLDQLLLRYPQIEEKDMKLIIGSFESHNLVEEISVGESLLYHVSKEGKLLLSKYLKAKETFKVEK